MPDFVSENSLDSSELEKQLAKAKAENEKHILDDASERKSLYEQLKESKEQKHLEYQKLLESQNSSYKLDEKSAKFYDDLKRAEMEREQKRMKDESERLKLYRDLKAKQSSAASVSSTATLPQNEISLKSTIIVRKRKNEKNPVSESQIKRGKESNHAQNLDLSKRSDEESINDCSTSGYPGFQTAQNKEKLSQTALQGLGDYTSSDDE